MCICLCSGEPLEDDPRAAYSHTWDTNMCGAPCKEPLCFCIGCLPCTQCYLRYKAIGQDCNNYSCCQGYLDVCCIKAGKVGDKQCPHLCLCIEATCCTGLALSATRMLVMDRHNIRPDPWDNRIIRFNNCIQILACICTILSYVIGGLDQVAEILRCIANVVWCMTSGCMSAQTTREMKVRNEWDAPGAVTMDRGQPKPDQQYVDQQQQYGGQPQYAQTQPQYGQQVAYGQPVQQQPVYAQAHPVQQQPQYGQQY